MKHLEQFKVAFIGANTRQVVEGGVVKTYFRSFFKINGKLYSVNTKGLDQSGKAGYVQFVKAGEDNTNGGKVAQDAFSFLYAASATTAASAAEALAGIE